MARLFVGVWPSEAVAEQLRALPRKDRPGIRWVRPENWHVTLQFLGEADPDEVATRLDNLALGPVDIRLGPGVDVLTDRTIIVPVHGIDEVATNVIDATRDLGTEPPRRRFTGHLALARVRRGARIPDVIGTPISATQRVEEIALVESVLKPDGAVYDTITTWAFG